MPYFEIAVGLKW